MTSWRTLRRQVYARDGGRCQVCLARVGRVWHLGHLVDRVKFGSDDASNVVVMCSTCNLRKPFTETRAEAIEWLEQARRGEDIRPAGATWRGVWEMCR